MISPLTTSGKVKFRLSNLCLATLVTFSEFVLFLTPFQKIWFSSWAQSMSPWLIEVSLFRIPGSWASRSYIKPCYSFCDFIGYFLKLGHFPRSALQPLTIESNSNQECSGVEPIPHKLGIKTRRNQIFSVWLVFILFPLWVSAKAYFKGMGADLSNSGIYKVTDLQSPLWQIPYFLILLPSRKRLQNVPLWLRDNLRIEWLENSVFGGSTGSWLLYCGFRSAWWP